MNENTWTERNVVITGASRGLGAALAEALVERRAGVVLVARNAAQLEEVVGRLRKRSPRVFGFAADVADKDATHRIAGFATAMLGRVDAVIHNASTLGPVPLVPLLDTACETWAQRSRRTWWAPSD